MKINHLVAASAAILLVACSETPAPEVEEAPAETMAAANPMLEDWDTPFGVPPFDRIESEHYLPAFRAAMKAHADEIDAITANADAPTFENTIEALELSGGMLSRVSRVFFAVDSANSDDVTKETAKTVAPELSAHRDNILLNKDLFERVLAVYEQRDSLDLSPEQAHLLDETHKQFVRSGANLDDEAQARLREINSELAGLSQQFGDNVLEETNNFELLVTDRADLGDLPQSLVALAAEEAKRRGHDCDECWVFTLQRPSINPFLQYSPNREMRKQLFDGYAMRVPTPNVSVVDLASHVERAPADVEAVNEQLRAAAEGRRAARASVVTVTLNPLGKRVGDYCTGRGAIAPREPLQIYNLDIGRFEVLSDEPAADASETARAIGRHQQQLPRTLLFVQQAVVGKHGRSNASRRARRVDDRGFITYYAPDCRPEQRKVRAP